MGGPAHQAAFLSGRRMDPARYECVLVHGSLAPGEESLAELCHDEGATTNFVSTLRQPVEPLQDLRALAKLSRIARNFEPHIIHTHTAKAGFLGRQAALAVRPRPSIVHTYHGHVLEGYFGAAKSGLYRRLERLMARRSDHLIGVSQATVGDLVRLGVAPQEKFSVVPLGLDLAPLAEADDGLRAGEREAMGLNAGDVLCIFVGRVVPIKRLDVLLDAFAAARKAEGRLKLAIVGDGDLRPELEKQAAELGISEAVRFLGYKSELKPMFAAADLAVLSSDNEGTPVSLIEAAAAGRPAVATDVGGVSEVVDDGTGVLVPAADPDAFAEALVELARDPEARQRMGTAAKQRALARFGVDRLLADIDSLYTELVAARAAA